MRTPLWIRVVCLLALAGALVAFTGCGGSSKKSSSSSSTLADYKAGATKAANDFKNSAQAASNKVQSGTTPAQKLAGLDDLKKSVTTAADDFGRLNPPANVQADNSELVKEFRSLATIIDDVQTAIKNKDQSKAVSVLGRLGTEQANITQTITRIQQKIGK